MSRIHRFACHAIALGLLLFSATSRAGESSQLPNHAGRVMQAFCWSSHNDYREPAMYLSEIFEIQVPKTAGIWYPRDMAKLYEAYLTQNHGYVTPPPGSPTVFCSLNDSVAMAQGSKNLLIEQHRYYKQPVVETGWKMSAQEAAAAVGAGSPKPAVAAAPSAPIYGYCSGNQGAKIYFSDIFSAADEATPGDNSVNRHKPATDRWAQSYNGWLVQIYGFQGTVRCSAFGKLEGAQAVWGRQTQINRNFGPDHHVETGWKYGSAG